MKTKWDLSIILIFTLTLSGNTAAIARPSYPDEGPVGIITGVITEEGTGQQLQGILVSASFMHEGQGGGYSTHTDINGVFTLTVEEGGYRVSFSDENGSFLSEFYADAASADLAAIVQVQAGATTTIEAALSHAGFIAGRIDPYRIVPVNVTVYLNAIDTSGVEEAWLHEIPITVFKDYRLGGLPTGSYKLRLAINIHRNPWPVSDFTRYYYNGGTTYAQADVIEVTAGSTTEGIDFDLTTTGRIRGTVINEVTEQPLGERFTVRAYNSDWELMAESYTDAGGNYEMNYLAPGEYTILFTGLVWPETCIHGCKPSQAYIDSGEQLKVQVTSGGTTEDVDAVVSPYFYRTYVPIVALFSSP